MDPVKAELIRKGNEAFNKGDYHTARDLFSKAGYKSGLIRIGDHYMYDRSLPLLAYGYYKRAGATNKIEDLHRRMIGAMGEWLGRDKLKKESLQMLQKGNAPVRKPVITADADGMVSVPVSPDLKKMAEKILSEKS